MPSKLPCVFIYGILEELESFDFQTARQSIRMFDDPKHEQDALPLATFSSNPFRSRE